MPNQITRRDPYRKRGQFRAPFSRRPGIQHPYFGAGGVQVGGTGVVQLQLAKWRIYGAGGVQVDGTAPAKIPTRLVVAYGAGGVLVGGTGYVRVPTLLLAHHPTGGAVSGGSATYERSSPRTVHQPGERYWTFRYELLDSSNTLIGDLEQVVSAEVSQNWFADVKRKARFTLREGGSLDIDWLADRIKPYARLHLPPYQPNDWVEWPLGVFLLSSPTRQADTVGVVRDVDGYDQLQVYLDDKVADRYTVAASASYIAAVTTLLGSVDQVVESSTAKLPAAMEWPPGTPKLTIINSLLSAVNYQSLSFDEDGRAIVQSYTPPSDRTEEYVYDDSDTGLVLPDVEQQLDLFSVPNEWVLVVSDPDKPLIVSTYTNDNPASPTSTVRRGRTIVDYRQQMDAADQATLDGIAQRLAFDASQVYESITFGTGINPIHSGNDVYRISYTRLAINSAFSEAEWTLPLKAGAKMTHRARRVVSI